MKLPVLLAVAALAVCLTGCSHAQTDATPFATSETAEAAATATPAATPATSAEPVHAEVGTILPETADAGRSYVDETLLSVIQTRHATCCTPTRPARHSQA